MSCWSWGRLPVRREWSQSTRPLGVSTRLPWSLRVTLEGLGRECALHCGTIGLAVDLGEPTVTTLPACSNHVGTIKSPDAHLPAPQRCP